MAESKVMPEELHKENIPSLEYKKIKEWEALLAMRIDAYKEKLLQLQYERGKRDLELAQVKIEPRDLFSRIDVMPTQINGRTPFIIHVPALEKQGAQIRKLFAENSELKEKVHQLELDFQIVLHKTTSKKRRSK